MDELAEQAHAVEEQLGDLLSRVEDQYGEQTEHGDEDDEDEEDEEDEDEDEEDDEDDDTNFAGNEIAVEPENAPEHEGIGYQYVGPDESVPPSSVQRIEELFGRAASDRTKAFELKRELDRLGLFKRYEDRFLDLFKQPE